VKTPRIPQRLQPWIEARKRHRLSDAHVQMARELGMNPKKLGKLDNDRQEPWKLPLKAFIEELYHKRFGRDRPDVVVSIEERAELEGRRREMRGAAKRDRREAKATAATTPSPAKIDESHAGVESERPAPSADEKIPF
jgi:hypothetical protein